MANKNPKNNQRTDRGKNRKAGNVKLRPEEERAKLAKQLGLKPKTKQFIDEMINNPKISQTEAYIRTHATNNRRVASVEASKLLAKPNVIGYKDSAVKKAKNRIVELVSSENESIALKASQDVIDRNEGKAIQKSESISRTVEVKVDLTGVKLGNHWLKPEQIQD